ncbi:MAG: hypothetical protein E6G68_04100 [Actinobacteria bacterium]|nr:MAG: hypothetical protein E6G68_04100 [Actinomycetota bacterium]
MAADRTHGRRAVRSAARPAGAARSRRSRPLPSAMTIRVLEPGAFTTVQDLGRPGWRSSGVPPSGAMDPLAFRLANLLAGNREDAAGLEITMIGPLLTFEHDAVVALAGASFDAELNGEPMPAERSVRVPAGATLRIAKARRGVRSYLALRGGVDVPPVLGSRSTFAQGGLGGVRGAALKPGDYLRAGTARGDAPMRRATPGAVFDPAGDVRRTVLVADVPRVAPIRPRRRAARRRADRPPCPRHRSRRRRRRRGADSRRRAADRARTRRSGHRRLREDRDGDHRRSPVDRAGSARRYAAFRGGRPIGSARRVA